MRRCSVGVVSSPTLRVETGSNEAQRNSARGSREPRAEEYLRGDNKYMAAGPHGGPYH